MQTHEEIYDIVDSISEWKFGMLEAVWSRLKFHEELLAELSVEKVISLILQWTISLVNMEHEKSSQWFSNLLFSRSTNEVTEYFRRATSRKYNKTWTSEGEKRIILNETKSILKKIKLVED